MACLPSTTVRIKSAINSLMLRSITYSVCETAGDAIATTTRFPNERSLSGKVFKSTIGFIKYIFFRLVFHSQRYLILVN